MREPITNNYHVQLLLIDRPIVYRLFKAYKNEGRITNDKDILLNIITDYDDVLNNKEEVKILPFSYMTYQEIEKTITKI